MADLDTETASDASNGSENIDLRRHSLNDVVGSNRKLWKKPSKWTQAHLQALSVDIDRQSDAGVDAHEQNLHRDKGGPPLNALIPDLPQDRLERYSTIMEADIYPQKKALALKSMLVFPLPCPPKDGNNPNTDDIVNISTDVVGGSQLGTEAVSFDYYGECVLTLAVGQDKYFLSIAFAFHLGPLLLIYLDSSQITSFRDLRCTHNLRCPRNFYESLEARIVALLIALAQIRRISKGQQVVVTRLLFTRWDDDDGIYVYTATISRHLLDRFRHPSRPPTAIMPSLIKLQPVRVPYKPHDTFRNRILAAVSVTTTIMKKDDYFSRRKRKCSGSGKEVNVKRPCNKKKLNSSFV
ncbi:hypothetical protein GGR51DRAFT_566036 [Nemania sp. FL0031]|nr:hypothetical protein GGR51DRAFT_566036 [Nemania sp. FL0031]